MIINDLLNYNNLKIAQSEEGFKFSLDSVLLPNFVTLNKNINKILDLCTGNAPIPLILSTKTNADIYGIEIQKDIYNLAIHSVKLNNLSKKITIINEDVKNITNKFESDTFDVITCNPPYFKVNNTSKLNINDKKTIARHEVLINLDDILKISKKLLKNNGVIAIVHRPERLLEILYKMKEHNIEPKKIQFVYPKMNMEANIVLIEGKKNGNKGLKILSPLYTHYDNGEYKEEILDMFK